ncbi:MAG: 3-oxoadipate enol-lactonase [Pseudomonadota bacterium]
MQVVRVGEVSLHLRDEGPRDGPALAFSNSLGTDFRTWDMLLPLLPAGLRVIRYDKRGHGLSDCPDSPGGPWRIEDHVADLEALLDTLGVRKAVICGLSVGGLIAQGLAARRPNLVRAVILCDTGAKIGTDAMWNDRIAKVEAGGIEAIAEGVLERWFTKRFRDEDPGFPLWRSMLVRTPKEGYLRTATAIRDTDYTERTRALSLPALAICGSEDGATPPALVKGTARLIEGCRYEEIADAGHLPCIEQPEVMAGLIGDFLREIEHV